MIGIQHFRPSSLSEVSAPAIVLPVSPTDGLFVVVAGEAGGTAVFLGEEHTYEVMETSGNENWRGLVIEDVVFEVDLGSAVSLNMADPVLGSLIRKDDGLFICAKLRDSIITRTGLLSVFKGLPNAAYRAGCAFNRWSVVKYDGEKEVFRKEFSANTAPSQS